MVVTEMSPSSVGHLFSVPPQRVWADRRAQSPLCRTPDMKAKGSLRGSGVPSLRGHRTGSNPGGVPC